MNSNFLQYKILSIFLAVFFSHCAYATPKDQPTLACEENFASLKNELLLGSVPLNVIEKLIARTPSIRAMKAPTLNPGNLPYQDLWEGLHVAAGKSKSLPLADGSRPERILYFRPEDNSAIAHSVVNGQVVRREFLQVVQNPESKEYELRASVEYVDSNGAVRRGAPDELKTCALCHSVSPAGKHLVHDLPTPKKYPELPDIADPGEPGRSALPRWPGP